MSTMSDSISSLTDTVQPLPSANISEKVGRKKSKKQILDTGLPVPELQQQSETITSPDGNLGNGEANKNPYIELIAKKLKAIKKRLNKIEKYEETLNDDQLASVKAKPELIGAQKELEEVLKQLEKIEIEEHHCEQQRRREVEERTKILIEEALIAERARGEALMINTLRFFYLVNAMNQGVLDRTINDVDMATISHLHMLLMTSAVNEGELGPFEYLEKLQRSEEENVAQGDTISVSYAKLRMLQDLCAGAQNASILEANEQPDYSKALDEAILIENGSVSSSKDMAEDQSQQEVTVLREEEEEDDDGEHLQIHIPQGGIQFMTNSEIFDVPEESTAMEPLAEPAIVSDLVTFSNEPSLPTDLTLTSQEGHPNHIQVPPAVNQQDQRPQHQHRNRGNHSNSYRSRVGNQQQSQSQQYRQDQYRHDQYRVDTAIGEGDQRSHRGRSSRQKSGGYRGSQQGQGQGQGRGGIWATNIRD